MVGRQATASRSDAKIYVVTDDPYAPDLVIALARRERRDSRVFMQNRAFLNICDELPDGCVILDLHGTASEALEIVQSLHLGCPGRFAIILVTAPNDAGTAIRALKAGAVDCLERPFSETDLSSALVVAFAQLARAQHRQDDLPLAGKARLARSRLVGRE